MQARHVHVPQVFPLGIGRAEKGQVEDAQNVNRREHEADDDDDSGNGIDFQCREKHEQFRPETRQPGQARPTQARDDEDGHGPRHLRAQAPEIPDGFGMGFVVEVPSRAEEQGGHDAVREHLKHRAIERVCACGGAQDREVEAEQDNAHVRHG